MLGDFDCVLTTFGKLSMRNELSVHTPVWQRDQYRTPQNVFFFIWMSLNKDRIYYTGRLRGYRSMTSVLHSKYHLRVSRDAVRNILRQMDPASVVGRTHHRLARRTYWSKGPNHCCHVDDYDKLRQYGFHISG